MSERACPQCGTSWKRVDQPSLLCRHAWHDTGERKCTACRWEDQGVFGEDCPQCGSPQCTCHHCKLRGSIDTLRKTIEQGRVRRPPFMWRWVWIPLREHVWYPIKRWWHGMGPRPRP